jgi:hypothetical protein
MPPSMYMKDARQLHEAFKRCDQLTQAKHLKAAVTVGLLPIQNQAIENAHRVTSTLVRSIHTEIIEARENYCEGVTGTNLDYARREEMGFTGSDALGREYNQPAHPYLRPAFDTRRREAVAEMGETLHDILMVLIA